MDGDGDLDHAVADALEFPSDSRMETAVLANGLRVEYARHGDASAPEKIVLLMGLAAQKEAWLPVVAAFFRVPGNRARFEILTPDNRGAGGTAGPRGRYKTSEMAQDTLQLLDHLGWGRVHLAGVSMGGMISQELAHAAPDRVLSLALLVTTPGFLEAPWPGWSQITAYLSIIRNFFVTTLHARTMLLMGVLYPAAFLTQHAATAAALYTIHSERLKLARRQPAGLMGQYAAVLTHRMSSARLGEIQQAGFPILVLGAGQDRLLHVSHSRVLGERLRAPRTKTIIADASGHGMHMQFRSAVVAALTVHFSSTRA
ncbi:Aste57867_14283 [Aphanomyces stellatus]|uniref:Aste57867_14283 protein n=1 Tax=Aphanomyces stellatus TaxID=120398 RepID=A0A485L123_9STRA|nr:hypothetical protein As57867_014231 [Aphanomyces stellatus]VFT91108.1 Aste57867_14283 [Aphanomyces stellatus]